MDERQCEHGFHHPTWPHSCDGCWCDDERDKVYGWPEGEPLPQLIRPVVLTREGADQLADMLDGPSAPVSTPGFMSKRITPWELNRYTEHLASRRNQTGTT